MEELKARIDSQKKVNLNLLAYFSNDDPSPENKRKTQLELVAKDGLLIRFIDNPTEEICLAAVKNKGNALQYIIKQTENICLAAVKNNGMSLRFVKNQTYEICLEAVKICGRALQFVRNQTDEICLAAVKNIGLALEYVKNQTDEICLASIKNYAGAIQFVKKQTEEMLLMVVEHGYAYNLEYAKPEYENINIYLTAARIDEYYINYIPKRILDKIYKPNAADANLERK